jgi:hypothetical protein
MDAVRRWLAEILSSCPCVRVERVRPRTPPKSGRRIFEHLPASRPTRIVLIVAKKARSVRGGGRPGLPICSS